LRRLAGVVIDLERQTPVEKLLDGVKGGKIEMAIGSSHGL
jgi:hypothetical protein